MSGTGVPERASRMGWWVRNRFRPSDKNGLSNNANGANRKSKVKRQSKGAPSSSPLTTSPRQRQRTSDHHQHKNLAFDQLKTDEFVSNTSRLVRKGNKYDPVFCQTPVCRCNCRCFGFHPGASLLACWLESKPQKPTPTGNQKRKIHDRATRNSRKPERSEKRAEEEKNAIVDPTVEKISDKDRECRRRRL